MHSNKETESIGGTTSVVDMRKISSVGNLLGLEFKDEQSTQIDLRTGYNHKLDFCRPSRHALIPSSPKAIVTMFYVKIYICIVLLLQEFQ